MSFFNFGKKHEPGPEKPAPSKPCRSDHRTEKEEFFKSSDSSGHAEKTGIKTHQIFDSLNQADLKSGAPVEQAVPPELAQQPQPPAPANQPPVQTETPLPPMEPETTRSAKPSGSRS